VSLGLAALATAPIAGPQGAAPTVLPTLPFAAIEWEFDAGAWTDVAPDVVSVGTRRGRNRESGAFETGTMTLTLRNDTRKYDPDNTAGPFYGKLRPNRRIRLRATYAGATYPIFVGYVDRITQQYGGPNDATAAVDVSDAFKLLNRAELPDSAWMAEIRTDAPKHWWRMGDPAGATVALDSVGVGTDAAVGAAPVVFGTAGLVTRDPDTAVTLGPTSGTLSSDILSTTVSDVGIGTNPSFTLEAIVRLTAISSNDAAVVALQIGNVGLYAVLFVGGAASGADQGKPLFLIDNGSTNWFTPFGPSINDGSPHHLAATVTAAGAMSLYVDGTLTGTATAGTYTLSTTTMPVNLGNMRSLTQGFIGDLDEVALYDYALPAARVAAHAGARSAPWNGDLPGPRLARILDLAAVPAADRDLDAGTTTLQATSTAGDALGYAQKVEETDAGRFFVAADGRVRYISREAAWTGGYLTPRFTLVDDDSGAGIPYRDVSAEVDEARIVTRATVSREGSVAITYSDAAALAEFKVLDETHDGLLHNSDTYSAAYAQWIVNTNKTPATRLGAVALEMTRDPANMYPAILALEIGDRVTYKRKPQNVGATITQDMRLEAVAHEYAAKYWRTRLQLSPFNLGAGGYGVGVWDVSLWDQATWGL